MGDFSAVADNVDDEFGCLRRNDGSGRNVGEATDPTVLLCDPLAERSAANIAPEALNVELGLHNETGLRKPAR